MADERILVIDDDRTVHSYLKGILGKAGYRVFTAVDALQGPMVARQANPHVIILDVAMPGGGGPVVLERLRSMQGMMHIPVLIYSGLSQERIEQLIPPGPGVALVVKPGTPEDVLEAVRRLLSQP
jgi:CheY-like chemotaxis protein